MEEGAQVPVEQGAAAAVTAESAQTPVEQQDPRDVAIKELKDQLALRTTEVAQLKEGLQKLEQRIEDLTKISKAQVEFLAQQQFNKELDVWQKLLQVLAIAGVVTAQEALGFGWNGTLEELQGK